jgi:SAM-dependent methyltransferase
MTEVFDAYAAYYDLLYRDKDYPGEARYVQSLLRRQGVSDGDILELGCGTGKHAEQLARLGFSVQGIDLSPSMVEIARKRTPSELASRLQFAVGDARSARIGKPFDAAISLFHVASYQTSNDDLAGMLRTASTHLKTGGIFVFDFWYGPAVLTDPPTERVKRLEDGVIQVVRTAKPTLWPNENVVDVHYQVQVKQNSNGRVAQIEETHRMRYLFLPELRWMLQEAGLEVLDAHSWMSGELGTGSWFGVIVARKRPQ